MGTMKIRDLNKPDRPRERLFKLGAKSLSDAELVAIILRSGGEGNSALVLGQSILKEFGGLKGLLDSSIEQLQGIKDVGLAKAACLKAVCELALRIGIAGELADKQQVRTPEDVFGLLRKELYAKKREHLYLLSLDSRNALISADLISIGTVNETLVHPREIYRQAILKNAVSVILVHNHPSGEPKPSAEDIVLTERVAKAGKEIGIALLDHVIVCDDVYASMKGMDLFSVGKFDEERG